MQLREIHDYEVLAVIHKRRDLQPDEIPHGELDL
jgi:hypothetical protein